MACGEDTRFKISTCTPSGVTSLSVNDEIGASYFLVGDIGSPTGDVFSGIALTSEEDETYTTNIISKTATHVCSIVVQPEKIELYTSGALKLTNFDNSVDDSGTSTPINFLYTDEHGNLKSAPISVLVGLVLAAL